MRSPSAAVVAVREWEQIARSATPMDLQRDQTVRTGVYDTLNAALAQVDLIAGPTTTCLPVADAERGKTVGPSQVNGVSINPLIGFCPTYLTNFSDSPSASLPSGLADGLPVGLMLIGRHQDELTLLSACSALESRTHFGVSVSIRQPKIVSIYRTIWSIRNFGTMALIT